MTLKEFMSSVFRLPARIFNDLSTLVLGGYAKNKDKPFLGLLGLLLEGVKSVLDLGKWIGRTITSFFKEHEKAIAAAFWMSLLIGGAAALTVAFWPAALALVANFTIAGYSIASVVGAGYAAQVAATAAVATVLTSAAVYTVAAVGNFVNFVKSCFTKDPFPANEAEFECDENAEAKTSVSALSKLSVAGPKVHTTASVVADSAPVHTTAVLKAKLPVIDEEAPVNTVGMSSSC
jgi:hypothetical protein